MDRTRVDDPAPTADQIRHAIDAGRAGDKVDMVDPAAAPLGTDEEAAGTRPSPAERTAAARTELRGDRPEPGKAANPRGRGGEMWVGAAIGVALAAVVALVLAGVFA